jgi:hypothetical protein
MNILNNRVSPLKMPTHDGAKNSVTRKQNIANYG